MPNSTIIEERYNHGKEIQTNSLIALCGMQNNQNYEKGKKFIRVIYDK